MVTIGEVEVAVQPMASLAVLEMAVADKRIPIGMR
jgi:hypothetical protein